jgi:hypothetical protein
VKSQGQDLDSANGNAADDSNVGDTSEDDDFKTDYADDEDSPSQNAINDDKKDDDAMLNKTDDDDNAATPDTRSAATIGEDQDASFDIVEDDDTDDDDEDDDDDDDGINIDPGFLKDAAGKEVKMPNTATTTTSTVAPPSPKAMYKGNATNNGGGGGPTIVFYFCVMGGTNAEGPVGLIDMLHIGLGQQQQMPMAAIAALPSALTGESSAAYTDAGITACGTGITLLTPYGYSYLPGSCYGYSFAQARWNDTGSRLASYRKGASITRVGKYLVAAGGSRGRRSLRSIEVKENITQR